MFTWIFSDVSFSISKTNSRMAIIRYSDAQDAKNVSILGNVVRNLCNLCKLCN